MTIYTASKVKHAHLWQSLRAAGVPINSTWIDESRDKESPSLPELWARCVMEAATASAVLLYVEPGDLLKGALVEVGAALACGVPVYIVGEPDGSWVNHPYCHRCESVDDAVIAIRHRFEGISEALTQ